MTSNRHLIKERMKCILLGMLLFALFPIGAMEHGYKKIPAIFQDLQLNPYVFYELRDRPGQGCQEVALEGIITLMDQHLAQKKVTIQRLARYRTDFLMLLQEAKLTNEGIRSVLASCIELRKYFYAKGASYQLFIQDSLIDQILSLMVPQERIDKETPDESIFYKCAGDPFVINKLLYEYNVFIPLYKKLRKKGLRGNFLKRITNIVKKKEYKVPLSYRSLFVRSLNGIRLNGMILDETLFAGKADRWGDHALSQKPSQRIAYIKACFAPRYYPSQLSSLDPELEKRIFTFLLCARCQALAKPVLKMPKAVMMRHIIEPLAVYSKAQQLKPYFIKDILQCRMQEYSDGQKGAAHFLYNQFEAWFDKKCQAL